MATAISNFFRIRTNESDTPIGLDGWTLTEPALFIDKFEFEEVDHDFWMRFYYEYWFYAFYVGAAYLTSIFALKEFMKSKEALQLRRPMFVWNLSLGIFSIIGFIRIAPAFFNVLLLSENGFFKSICVREGVDKPTLFWYLAFGLSKFFELGDTIFIVLRKRPLVLLQWYHHLITMIVQWLVGPYGEPITRWYVIMNYGVHSLMYPYFAFKSIGVRIPTWISRLITTLQLLQMVVGLSVNMYTIYLIQNGVECSRHPFSIRIFILVYASFTVLFGKLFYDNIIAPKYRESKNIKSKTKKLQ